MPNSSAVIGAPTNATVTEDTNLQILTAQGAISISDANAGQSAFKTTVVAASGDLGTLSIAANGAYVYSVADSKVQYLGAGETKVDTFTVTSLDGTTKQVAFTIIGVNDAAVIGIPTVVDVTEDATSPTLKATGSISITDADHGQATFKTTVAAAAGNLGTLVLQSNGSYTYSVADSAVQYLGAGQVKTDTFTVTSLDGTTKQISFNIHGTNDAAVIGVPTQRDVTEDATAPNLSVTGSISISDADQGQAAFKATVTSASGNLGGLVLAANGTYTYSVSNSATQYLGAGDTKVDTFTVTSLDGTTKQVSFTIHGINDAAVIGTPTVHNITEDATNPVLYATGTVSIADADQGESAFQPTIQAGNGNLGVLVMGSNGAYVYAALDSAVQYLGAGDTKVDTFTLTALDGTQKQVTFTIHGTNDAAVIGAPVVHDVTEDVGVSAAGVLTAAGVLSIADADQNQASFQTVAVAAAAGTLGHLSIAANGPYSYTVADSAVQYLGANDVKTETFTVTAFDGTQKQVSFTIHGTNDAAVIGTPFQHDVTKNGSPVTLTASGILFISDADQNQSAFKTTVVSASSNLGHLSIVADGSYTYSVANSATQYLGAADTKVDTFTVTSLDGTQKQISFTIHGGSGANTPAVISDPSSATVTEDVGGATLSVSGTITVTDPDAGQAGLQTAFTSGTGNIGSLSLQSNGSYTYSVADSAVQYLGLGQNKVDTFTVTSIDGVQKVVSFTIQGANDTALIGDPVVHVVTEDSGGATLSATGKLIVSDADQNQSSFQAGSVADATNLSSLSLAADGTYTYSVANSAVQYLGATDTRTDTFTVHSVDGTPKVISFTIQGVNDAAVIGDPVVRSVTEDVNPTAAGNLTAGGQLTAIDPDQGQSSFQAATLTGPGNLGTLSLAADGTYTYSVANSATQSLGAGQTHTDVFTVHSFDGTAKTVSFDVHGANDAAVISDPVLHDVTEDAASLSVSGQMTATDADAGQSLFSTVVMAASGTLGQMTISSDGHYTYTVDNSLVQGLAAGEIKVETFTVSSVDGTAKPVSFTIHGTQDAPLLVAHAASGTDDAPIALVIDTHLVDDAGALSTITIKGIPDSYKLDHGTVFDDGHWEVAAADLGDLHLVPLSGAHQQSLALQVSVASIEGGHQAVQTAPMTVDVGAGLHDSVKRAVDGYIAGAFVFADADGNGVYTAGEASAITGADGSFTLHDPHGTLIMTGGTDISTGLAFTGTLKAPDGATVVTPLTTLISSITATGVSTADATAQVAAAFGIDTSTSGIVLTAYDPVPAAVSGDLVATAVLSAGVQVQSTVAQISAVGATSSVFDAIAGTITSAGTGGTIDLSTGSTVADIVAASGVSGTAAEIVTSTVSAANDSIQAAGNVTQIAQAGQVAQGAATTDLATAAAGNFSDPDQLTAIQDHYADPAGLAVQVAAAQVAVLAPVFGTSGNDVLIGTTDIDTIDAREGNDQISGGDGADVLFGGAGNDRIAGNAGNDRIDGGTGFDRALYTDATGGIAVDMAAGTVSGDASVGSDVLVNVEAIVGSDFADTYDATGFAGVTGVAGAVVGYNEFEGGKGNDQITGLLNGPGQALTRVSYLHATDSVTVDIQAHSAHATNGTAAEDLASVGQDSFTNVSGVIGSGFNDTLRGSNNGPGTFESYEGRAGNDLIDGRGGYDIAVYSNDATTTAGITVNLAAGTVVGDSTIGTDTLAAVEAVRGTNFDDVFDATGFGATGANIGSLGTFNDFQGAGGNDTIIGNGATRLNYTNAAGAVTVDLQGTTVSANPLLVAGTATAFGEGTDTFTGVNAVQGSSFGDTLLGSNFNNTFTGLGGDDYIDGRGGFDVASYNSLTTATTGVSVNLALGTATGISDGSIGHDTLHSIEGIQGTFFADQFDATGYGQAGATNVSNSNGSFNQFEGLAGDDLITGNGNTRVIYANAAAGVTVDLSLGTAHGTAVGDAAAIGTDTITGVNSITGSAFGDTLIGDGNSNTFVGGGGNDTIDGGGKGDIAVFSGARGQYNISIDGSGQVTVADNVLGRDGTDTLTNVEVVQSNNANLLVASGTAANPVDLSDNRLFFNAQANPLATLTGAANDYVKIHQGLSGHLIDLGAGTDDTVMLGVTGGYNLNLANVEHLVGTGGNDSVNFLTNVNGLSIDMGGGNDNVVLANGVNSLGAIGIEILTGNDFSPGSVSNDTLTLLNDVSGVSINLGNGINTLNLAAGANSFTNILNVDTTKGTASDDTLTVASGLSSPGTGPSIDLGAGDDTLQIGGTFLNASLHGVEHLVGSAGDDFYSLTNAVSGLSVDLGIGNDTLSLANGSNAVSVANVESINGNDFASGSVSDDTLTLLGNVSGLSVNLGNGINTLNLAAGANSFTGLFVQHIYGTASDDTLTVSSQYGSFALHDIEHLVVSGQQDAFYVLTNDQNGLSVDLGAGNTGLSVAAGANTLSVTNVHSIGTSDYNGIGGTPASDDTLTLTNDVTGVTINMQQGDNTLNLAAGTNSITAYNVQHINGGASDDALTIFNSGGNIIDLGVGNDTLNLVGASSVTVRNVEHVNGGAQTDFITVADATGTTTVTGGGGSDFIAAGAAVDVIRYTDASESSAATSMDTVTNFDATQDKFLLDGVAGLAGSVRFMASGVLDGSPAAPHAEAILVDVGGQQQMQIDVNGDGVIGAGDITVVMNGVSGTLSDANFAVITPNHAPTDILLSGAAIVPENSAPGSVVGLLSDMDPDAGDGATYALTSNPGALFAIVNGNQLVTTAPLDFEQAASHQITVQVTDTAGATYGKTLQIGVTNVNEAPTDIHLSNASVAENSVATTLVGNLSTIDPDAGDAATYTLIDNAGGLFGLVANQVVIAAPIDFETAASHQITVRATDALGLSVDRTFTIATTDVNEAPIAVLLSNSSVAENSAANAVVGALSAMDPDAGDTATFTLIDNSGGLFAISGGNLVTAGPLNYEQATSHSVTVRVTDSGNLTHDATFNIATTNVNEAPTDISLSNTVIPQGTASGTAVGALSALDPDAGDSFTYALIDNAGGQFGISGGNLVVAGALTTGTEQVAVLATDAGGLSFQKTIGITVNAGALVVGTSGPDTLTGTTSDDTIQGLGGNDRLQGRAGNDVIDGGQGFDRAIYSDAAGGITADLAAGTVSGPGVGSDTLTNVEGIVGSAFADNISAAGFHGDAGILGTNVGFNEIEGGAGDDTITSGVNSQGALLTRISYANAAGSVTVDLAAHAATGGDGSDTLVGNGFAGVVGSASVDQLLGSNNGAGTVEVFEGRAGNDTLNGRGGFDRADYNQDPAAQGTGITVNLSAGQVVGDAVTVGTDALLSIESVRGTNSADSFNATGFSGTSGVNRGSNGTFNEFIGMGGNDTVTGNFNTRIAFTNATGTVQVDLQTDSTVGVLGATTGKGVATGDASTGTDTFTGVNAVMGSMYNDTIFGSNATTVNETFTGLGGDDFIDGRGGFDIISYNNIYFSTGSVTINFTAGTATGDASIGNDIFRGIEAAQGTNFNDVFVATNFGAVGFQDTSANNVGNAGFGNFNQFEGLGGDDAITGNGNTRIIYSSAATAGVSINLQAGTAAGANVGNDTFAGVNSATGTNFDDVYNAAVFTGVTSAGSFGTFNLFEGLLGDDTITGNGNTRIAYSQSATAVNVNLATGIATGSSIGTDTIFGGVNSVQGSNSADTLTGGAGNELFFGNGGADTINGGGGSDTIFGQGGNDAIDGGTGTDMAAFTGSRGQYTVSTNGTTGVTTVTDTVGGRDGADTPTNVEVMQFSDGTYLLNSGTSPSPVDISAFNLGAGAITGTDADDFLAVGTGIFGHQIDLGAGSNDTVSLASPNFYQLNLLNVEHVTGSTGNDNVNLVTNAVGLAVDLGSGNDSMTLAGGVNSLSVTNVELLTTNDFSGAAINDTLTLLTNVSGMSVHLAQGDNTLNLAAGANSLVDISNVQHVNGTASDDTLTLTDTIYEPGSNPVVDLAGGFDVLSIGSQYAVLSAVNVEQLNGSLLDNGFTLNNNVSGIAVDLGDGIDNLVLAGGANSLSLFNVENLNTNDWTGAPVDDTVTLLDNVSGLSVNLAQGDNTLNLAAGANTLANVYNVEHVNGSAGDDVLTLTGGIFTPDNNPIVDLDGGDNTLNFGGGGFTMTALNVQHVNGNALDNFVAFNNNLAGVSIDLGAGVDHVNLSNGANSVSLTGVENVGGTDFTGGLAPSDDTLNLLNDVSGLSVDLADGSNTLNLAAGTNSLDSLFNIAHLNASASDDVLTITEQSFATVFDMGGGNDTLNFGGTAHGVTVVNAETVNGSVGDDFITIGNTAGTTTVTGGLGADTIVASAAVDNFHFASAAESQTGAGDTIVNFDAGSDTFNFAGISAQFATPVHFMDTATFDGSAGSPHSEARIDQTGGNATLQIDVNGDGLMGGNDIEIHLTNYTGTLHDTNFIVS